MKVIDLLTRLLSRWNEFPSGNKPDLSKLKPLKYEMFSMYEHDRQISECMHSVYLQRLIELMIQLEIIQDGTITSDMDDIQDNKFVIEFRLSGSYDKSEEKTPLQSRSPSANFIRRGSAQGNEEADKLTKKEKKEKEKDRKEVKKKDERPIVVDKSWFSTAVNTTNMISQLFRGSNFPHSFIKEAFKSSQKQIVVEDSPHPYPPGVRVTSTVHISGAQSLVVTFDPRSKTHPNMDYLMFSRFYVGGDDLGIYSGDFPHEPVIVSGDRFIWSFLSDAQPGQEMWGFRFVVTPNFPEEILLDLEDQCEAEFTKLVHLSDEWTLAKDHELVEFINSYCEKSHTSSQEYTIDKVDPFEFSAYPLLSDLSRESLEQRISLLKYFNSMVSALIPLVDLRNLAEERSLAYLVCALRGLIFYDVKVGFLNDIISVTRSYLRRPILSLNRQQDKLKEECLFLQAFNDLHRLDPAILKQNDRAFEVKLEKEGAEDAGGPYREAITQFCQDIQSKELGLFIACPNAKEEFGFNQDKYIPNPSATSPSQLAQFEFIGKLIGIGIRTKNSLDLSFPSIVWKPLIGARIDRSDLEAIDKRCSQFLESIRNIAKEGVREETFSDYIFETFSFQSADGRNVELKPGGKNIPVTWQNRYEFTNLAEQYRLNEFNLQTEAICRGVASIIPIHLLSTFTWQELEFRVCGRAGVDLDLLQRRTDYYGVSITDRHVVDFWAILKSFTPQEQALFLRFVSGRSRLPPESEFTTQFQLQAFTKAKEGQEDNYLPEAQTCFFSLSLPAYSNSRIMREKLLYAINTCKEIDTDFIVRDTIIPVDENDASSSDSEKEDETECTTQ